MSVDLIHAVKLLRMEAHGRRSVSKPTAHSITDHTAKENLALAECYEEAANELLRIRKGRSDACWDKFKEAVGSGK